MPSTRDTTTPLLALRASAAVCIMRIKKTLIANLLVIASSAAYGAGLGPITIKSSLGEPLLAEIDLLAVSKDELGTLEAQLAKPEIYAERNIAFDPVLAGARVEILRRADGQPYLKITSNKAISEPALDLVVEVVWSGGQLLREYAAFMDPPGYVANARVVEPAVITVVPAMPVRPAVPVAASEVKANVEVAAVVVPEVVAATPAVEPPAITAAVPSDDAVAPAATDEAAPKSEATIEDVISRVARAAPTSPSVPETQSIAAVPAETKATTPANAKAAAPRRDALRLTTTEVQVDPKIAAERKILADRARALEERLHAKRMELRNLDERIATLTLNVAGERVRTLESMLTTKTDELKTVDQQIQALRGESDTATTAASGPELNVASGSDTLRRLQSLAMDAKPIGLASATSLVQMVAPTISWLTDPSHFDDPLVVAGGGLGLAMAGGLGIWMIRRRRKPDNAFLAMPAVTPTVPHYIAPIEQGDVASKVDALRSTMALEDHLKALERLAEQKNIVGFRRYAEEIAAATGRVGPVWEKIAAMGGVLDRFNPLYVVVRTDRTEQAAAQPAVQAEVKPSAVVPHMEFPRDWLTPESTRA
jgi:Tfp pilus assembly protein FimV